MRYLAKPIQHPTQYVESKRHGVIDIAFAHGQQQLMLAQPNQSTSEKHNPVITALIGCVEASLQHRIAVGSSVPSN